MRYSNVWPWKSINIAKDIYGIGSPIFILSEYMFVSSASGMFSNDSIELNSFLMYNLGQGHGYSIGFKMDYTINDNFQTSINISKFLQQNQILSINLVLNFNP